MLYRLVFDDAERAMKVAEPKYATLREDLAKWNTLLVSPENKNASEGLPLWSRTQFSYTFEANIAPPPPDALESTMSRLEQMLMEEEHPGARAVLGLFGIGYIQPFAEGDTNEMLGRLLMNRLLVVGGYRRA